jgi:hypothetical protein
MPDLLTGKRLDANEINTHFPDAWVLVGEPVVDEHLRVVSGKMLWHSPHRDEIERKLLELRPTRPAILYTGRKPEDMEYVL